MDGVRTGEGGVRELQGGWPGLHWGRWEVADALQPPHRAPMAACESWGCA